MKTYFTLIQKVCNCKNIIYFEQSFTFDYLCIKKNWENLKNEEENRNLMHMYFYMNKLSSSKNLHEFIKNKHSTIYEYNNIHFMRETYIELLDILYKVQRHYNALSNFVKIVKYKKPAYITDDLLLNPITEKTRHMKIIHENKMYLFTIKDLINIVNSSLSNCSSFYAEPKHIKNPYNNVIFENNILYNIYYAIKSSDYTLPMLFHNYYLCDFNLRNFAIENEYLIRDIYIKTVVYNTDELSLFQTMKRMIEKNLRSIKIDDNIDKSRFIKIIRPYYYLYLTKMYHVQGVEKTYKSDELLTKKLKELYDYNCSFGRLMLKREPITHKFKYIHDLDHPKFTMKDAMNYEKDLIHNTTSNIIYNETNPDTDTIINTDTDSDDEYQMN